MGNGDARGLLIGLYAASPLTRLESLTLASHWIIL